MKVHLVEKMKTESETVHKSSKKKQQNPVLQIVSDGYDSFAKLFESEDDQSEFFGFCIDLEVLFQSRYEESTFLGFANTLVSSESDDTFLGFDL